MKQINLLKKAKAASLTFILMMNSFLHMMSNSVYAQQVIQSNQVFTDETNDDHQPCITKEINDKMKIRLQNNITRLKAQGTLFASQQKTSMVTQTFAWPLTYNSNFYDNDYYYIQNYIDHDATIGSVLEYNCGNRTYDKPDNGGYNHSGTDICIGPYYWSMMDSMFVHVIAAAPGQIVDMDDGNYDRNCAFASGSANYVVIMHSDSSLAKYFHMKTGSVTSKIVGDMVEEGEYLGLVGSSGSSTNPHLHFEVEDKSGDIKDPWVGPCNPDISTSLWKNQLPYYNPGILRLMTLSGPVTSSNCPDPEPLTISNHFNPSDFMRFEIHLRDIVPGLQVNMTVTDHNGNQVLAVNYTNSGSFSPAGMYFYNFILPSGTGTYKMAVTYGGKSAVHYFTVGCPGTYNLALPQTGKKGFLSGSNIISISSISGSSSNNIWYEAESYIQVVPGFRATKGCTFTARINNCTVGNARNNENEIIDDEISTTSSLIALPSVANNESKLEFRLAIDDEITLSILDLTGRKINTLIDGKQNTKGIHQVYCNTSSFANGIYIIKMNGKHNEASCRLVIQH